ncbi:carboxylesterase family protein [Cesiribacter sp. SM1]|uniref:carboxylesterase family protein n=1 Tax=Cesiribacter sp. SM1 TaxID=2861196 RepID=UPI001CD2B7E7|nr:carboxylesterase family protein [Cesiribacter sp. SM1]
MFFWSLQTLPSFVNRRCKSADHKLAAVISSYRANFIKSGDRNGKELPHWPAYKSSEKQVMVFDKKPEAKPTTDGAALDFLSTQIQ